jgi:hypothetical protein
LPVMQVIEKPRKRGRSGHEPALCKRPQAGSGRPRRECPLLYTRAPYSAPGWPLRALRRDIHGGEYEQESPGQPH